MEENQFQTDSQVSSAETYEPASLDNSEFQNESVDLAQHQQINEGQSTLDPSENLILGKFKSVEDLSKAYEELQRYQGTCSEELGALRKNAASFKELQDKFELIQKFHQSSANFLKENREKYNSPEYFQDTTFREIYQEAFAALGENLDTDRLVNLLESYVSSRIFANERKKAANSETQKVLDSMTYEKNTKSSLNPPKKRFDEMTPKEIDEMLERLI